jgi:predicted TPR repeat methyltransferase
MLAKPKHLESQYGAQFQDRSVVAAYEYRPPYTPQVFDILDSLITDTPRVVLDVGCGNGRIARQLVERVDRVDAVDWSEAMLEAGKQLPGGDHPRLT